jgi:hypothetical protein
VDNQPDVTYDVLGELAERRLGRRPATEGEGAETLAAFAADTVLPC